MGDAEEEFNLNDVEFDESGANPTPSDAANRSPSSSGRPEVAAKESATSATPTLKRRQHRTANEEREAKKDEFIKMRRLNMLSTHENALVERQQRRDKQRASSQQLMKMIVTSLASMAAAWAAGNKAASAVFRPGQEPIVKELDKEQEEALQEAAAAAAAAPKRLRRSN